jgi:15-cis-phytoene synthase
MKDLQRIALAYSRLECREALSALFDLDDALGRIVSSTTEPMIGQMRLTWWHDRLASLEREAAAPAEPILNALRDIVDSALMTGNALAAMVEGWEALLEPMPLDIDALQVFAQKRGEGLFVLAASICQNSVPNGLGAGWALIDFAMHCSDERTAVKALQLAGVYFSDTNISGPKPLRILSNVARAKAKQGPESVRKPIGHMVILRAILR